MGWIWLPFTLNPEQPVLVPPETANLLPHQLHELQLWFWGRSVGAKVPHYSTDIAAAWEVCEKFKAENYYVMVRAFHDQSQWDCMIQKDHNAQIFDELQPTAHLAICIAALRAVGVEVPE